MTDDNSNVIPFGKHKGKRIEEVLAADPQYLEWLSGQDWFRAKFVYLHQVIVNRGAEAEETPEHNAIQVRFLDDAFCRAFFLHLYPDVEEKVRNRRAILERDIETSEEALRKLEKQNDHSNFHWMRTRDAREVLAERRAQYEKFCAAPPPTLKLEFEREFEMRGVDVWLHVKSNFEAHGFCIEIKPTVGDDYPAVLRQMRANRSKYLLVGRYAGTGATCAQFAMTFASAGIRVVFLDEVEARLAEQKVS